MRNRARRFALPTTLLVFTGVVLSGYITVDDHAEASSIPLTYEHWVGEFPQADNADRAENADELRHYAEWVLDQIGVPPAEQAARHPAGDCGIMTALDMVGLYLTQTEYEAANGLVGQGGLTAAAESFSVDLIEPVEVSGPWTAMGQTGVEIYPTGVQRVGTPDWTASNAQPPSMSQVRVAVVDTGIAIHPDLNIVDGRNCSGDARGPEGWGADPHGHGTHVAGTIGAIASNDMYVEGIAPGVPLIDATVFGESGSASSMTVLMGLNTALELDADVINLSLGGDHTPQRCGGPDPWTNGFCKAAQQAVIVVAAGNDTLDAVNKGPANIPTLLTVGAIVDFDGLPGSQEIGYPGCGFTHRDDFLAVFSNFGLGVDVVAPGGCILSTLPLAQWGHLSGTSMASPHSAGVMANFMARYPDCDGADAVKAVVRYAERYADAHPDDYSGWPGYEPPPMIRYVAEDPPEYGYVDPDDPRDPCIIGTEVPS